MANDYVGRYGEALRRLRAIDNPTPTGIASAGASVLPQQGAFAEQRPPSAQQGAFNRGPFDPNVPISSGDLYKQIPKEVKDQMADHLKENGVDIDQAYQKEVTSGNIVAPKKEPDKHEKLGYLAEVALRTISNLNRPTKNSAGDWADAVLETDARRSGIDERARLEARTDAEQAHREGREDTRFSTIDQRAIQAEERARAQHEADLGATAEENRKNRESQERTARENRASIERTSARPRLQPNQEGDLFLINDAGQATPVTQKKKVKTVVPGHRGVKPAEVERTVDEQLRVLNRDTNGVDKDTLLRQIGERVKLLKEDRKLANKLRAAGKDPSAEITRQATAEVMAEYAELNGTSAPGRQPAAPSNAFDQFDQ